ncbi:hypothetical protein GGX14DRAFT_573200 [Mycena pura]|uniref:Uncharacterized protein n=1 Tax=Mycena pura TaxID=153505 RepID=A0AAD6V3R7_9AGAR|nr:hypothetical protein GGX14DRAFT_573200 [Mycena pura]
MASHPCAVHVIRDHGFSGRPRKYWLVSGVNVKQPGAYVPWSSADAQCTGVPGATCKSYDASQWNQLESAWHASCLRGEHGDHEWLDESALQQFPTPTLASRAPTRTPALRPASDSVPLAGSSRSPRTPQRAHPGVTPATRIVMIDSRSPSPNSDTPSPSTISSSSPATAASNTPARQWVYAVRTRALGQIFDTFGPARDFYLRLQQRGFHPNLAISRSLTAAVGFVQEELLSQPAADDTPENREHWIREEILAHMALHGGSET